MPVWAEWESRLVSRAGWESRILCVSVGKWLKLSELQVSVLPDGDHVAFGTSW